MTGWTGERPASQDWVTEAFEQSRPRLRAVAYRMLGSTADADDAVQETWLRLHRADPAAIENFQGWLTTVVARICLDALRGRRAQPEPDLEDGTDESADQDVLLADSIGPALMVLLDRLAPAERLAFVLHDLFAVPFDEIAPVVGRSPAATRQLASRARRRVQGGGGGEALPGPGTRQRQQQVVDAFFAAARGGDFASLLAVLDPDVVVRADRVAVDLAARRAAGAGAAGGGPRRLEGEVHGAEAAAQLFAGWARGAQSAVVDGRAGAVWAPGGHVRSVFVLHVVGDRIVTIDVIADPDRIGRMALTF